MKHKFTVLIVMLVFIFATTGLVSVACYENSKVRVTSGKVVQTDKDKKEIEVQLGESGPRVFVNDLGKFNITDFKYGDTVELQFQFRNYSIKSVSDPD